MKPIKVIDQNKAAIEAALKDVNGKAEAHTFTTYEAIRLAAMQAEGRLLALLTKKLAPGAIWRETSGQPVSNAYAKKSWGPRVGTFIELHRRSTDWFLVKVEPHSVWKEGGSGHLSLTQAQADEAMAIFRIRNFSIQPKDAS